MKATCANTDWIDIPAVERHGFEACSQHHRQPSFWRGAYDQHLLERQERERESSWGPALAAIGWWGGRNWWCRRCFLSVKIPSRLIQDNIVDPCITQRSLRNVLRILRSYVRRQVFHNHKVFSELQEPVHLPWSLSRPCAMFWEKFLCEAALSSSSSAASFWRPMALSFATTSAAMLFAASLGAARVAFVIFGLAGKAAEDCSASFKLAHFASWRVFGRLRDQKSHFR